MKLEKRKEKRENILFTQSKFFSNVVEQLDHLQFVEYVEDIQ